MSSVLHCPYCNGKMSIAPEHAGAVVACPHCGNMVSTPPVATAFEPPMVAPVENVPVDTTRRQPRRTPRRSSSWVTTAIVSLLGAFVTLSTTFGGCCLWFMNEAGEVHKKHTQELELEAFAAEKARASLTQYGFPGAIRSVSLIKGRGGRSVYGIVRHNGADHRFTCNYHVRLPNQYSWELRKLEVGHEVIFKAKL